MQTFSSLYMLRVCSALRLGVVRCYLSPDLIDCVELERTVANLNKELAASCKAEGALRAQLEELASFQTLPDKVDNLMKQVSPQDILKG